MKRNNKKGFTIVELVIVIAVIAILAAVLIPTFASVTRKAKLSADKQTVRQMNVALAVGEDVDTYNEMADILIEQGYNGDQTLIPSSKGYSYYWVQEYNTIVLVKDGEVVFPEESKYDNFDANAEGVYAFLAGNYIVTSTATTSAEVVTDMQQAVAKGNSFTLAEKVEEPIVLPVTPVAEGSSIKVDLAGSTLSTTIRPNNDQTPQQAYGFGVYGELELDNAVIEARGVEVYKGGVMTLGEGVKVNATGTGGSAIYVWEGGEAIINGGEYYTSTESDSLYAATAINSYGKLTINGGKFVNDKTQVYAVNINGGEAVIKNATIEGAAGLGVTGGAKVTIDNCTITQLNSSFSSRHAVAIDGTNTNVKISKTTITGTTGYALCVHDENGVPASVVIEADVVISGTYNVAPTCASIVTDKRA